MLRIFDFTFTSVGYPWRVLSEEVMGQMYVSFKSFWMLYREWIKKGQAWMWKDQAGSEYCGLYLEYGWWQQSDVWEILGT